MPKSAHPELQRLRNSIDNIDAALVHLLAERFKFTRAVGEFKASRGLPPADLAREAEQIAAPPEARPSGKTRSGFRREISGFHRA